MSDFHDGLSQSLLLQHLRDPRNREGLENGKGPGRATNPICNDLVEIWVETSAGVITEVGFTGQGCPISQATASILTTAAPGWTAEDVDRLRPIMEELLGRDPKTPVPSKPQAVNQSAAADSSTPSADLGPPNDAPDTPRSADLELLGDLRFLSGLGQIHRKKRCVLMSFDALKAALTGALN